MHQQLGGKVLLWLLWFLRLFLRLLLLLLLGWNVDKELACNV